MVEVGVDEVRRALGGDEVFEEGFGGFDQVGWERAGFAVEAFAEVCEVCGAVGCCGDLAGYWTSFRWFYCR